jgi:DNA-directed RNA polymerase subunit RPC12/RpoP
MGVFFGFLLALVALAALSPPALKWIRDRLRERLEALPTRLELTGTAWEEQWLGLMLVGRQEDTSVALVARPWGPFELRVGIHASLPFGLSLTPQAGDVRLQGLQDIQVGVPDLDAAFQIQCENPAAAIRFMRDERTQRSLRAVLEADPKASVLGGEVRLSVPRSSPPEQLRRQIQAALRSARGLREVAGPEPVLPASPAVEGREAPRPSAPVPAARVPPAHVALELQRFSAEYVHRMRLKHQQRRMMLWGLYGLGAAFLFLPVAREFRWPLGPLGPLVDFFLEWDIALFLPVMGFVILRAVLYRCPACSTALPPFDPSAREAVSLLWRRRHIRCSHCGLQLQ